MEMQSHKPLDNAYFYLLNVKSRLVMRCDNASRMYHTKFSPSGNILTAVSMATSGVKIWVMWPLHRIPMSSLAQGNRAPLRVLRPLPVPEEAKLAALRASTLTHPRLRKFRHPRIEVHNQDAWLIAVFSCFAANELLTRTRSLARSRMTLPPSFPAFACRAACLALICCLIT